jgi:hypothetical protein
MSSMFRLNLSKKFLTLMNDNVTQFDIFTCQNILPNLISLKNHVFNQVLFIDYPTSTRRHGNFAGVHTLLRIILSSNSAVLINIITGVSPPHFDFVVYYVLCQC